MKKTVIPILATVIVVAAMAFQAMTPTPTVAEPPKVVLPKIAGLQLETMEPSEEEIANLPKDTRFVKGRYFADDGSWHLVSFVIGGISKSSIHRPELCLPSQGFEMRSPRNGEIGGKPWRFISLCRRDAVNNFAYTFYNQAGYRTASHVRRIFRDVCDRSFLNRIDRWVMITVYSGGSGEAGQRKFLAELERGLE